jgi:hypothetical protein
VICDCTGGLWLFMSFFVMGIWWLRWRGLVVGSQSLIRFGMCILLIVFFFFSTSRQTS